MSMTKLAALMHKPPTTSIFKSYISSGRRGKQQIRTACAAPRRFHHLTTTGRTLRAPALSISTAGMTAGQPMPETSGVDGGVKEGSHKGATGSTRAKRPINLLRGWPSTTLLPAAALRAASQTALSDPAIWTPGLEYAPDPGYQPLREALAGWLGRFYSSVLPVTPPSGVAASGVSGGEGEEAEEAADRITITGGASQSLACLLQSFTDPARTLAVWVVAPCYFLACPIFADAGFAGRMRAVPEDGEGVDVGVLEREMAALEERRRANGKDRDSDGEGGLGYKDKDPRRKIYRHVVYCVPSFSNPSGRTTTLARRRALVAVARRHDALVICDDVYDMLQWRVESPPSSPSSSPASPPTDLTKALLPRVVDIDIAAGRSPHDPPGRHFGHAVSNGSFSKLVAPGARTGWTYSTADFAHGASQTGSTRSGGAASQLAATIVCELLLSPSPQTRPGDGDGGSEVAEGEEECVLDAHIRHTLLPSYARRHALLVRAVRAHLLPLGVRLLEGSLRERDGVYGGYFIWMTLPHAGTPTETKTADETRRWPTASAIADRCRADEALMIGNGELFAVHGDEEGAAAPRVDDAVRLCFAWEDEENLVEGVERLARVLRRMLEEGPESWGVRRGGVEGVDQAK
ncbi:pyridoxal phosphate-dependent transferase [Nemania diffusa]|nr:pyridoxal phosphate-dependent transferase [Nemania diffusa]